MDHRNLAATLTLLKSSGDLAECVISTESPDLAGDTIRQAGMDVETYVRGTGSVNFSHRYDALPVGKAESIIKTAGGIRMRFRWITGDATADAVRNTYGQGALGASVGILVKDARPNQSGGLDIVKSVLTEVSLTPVPMNPQCLALLKALPWPGTDRELRPEPHEIAEALDDIRRDPRTVEDIRQDLARQLARAIRRQVGEQVARLRGRVYDDLDHEHEIRELKLDGAAATLDTLPVDLDQLKAEVRGALREVLQGEVDAQLRRLTGRVD